MPLIVCDVCHGHGVLPNQCTYTGWRTCYACDGRGQRVVVDDAMVKRGAEAMKNKLKAHCFPWCDKGAV